MAPIVNVEEISGTFPLFIYRRISLATARPPFFFAIDPGYWYWLRFLRAKWYEQDSDDPGLGLAPEINIEIVESSVHRVHQNAPVSLRLLCSPASSGCQLTAFGHTATPATGQKILNEMRPFRDNITFYVTGQNLAGTVFPAYVDIVCIGYMIPDKRSVAWKGTNDE